MTARTDRPLPRLRPSLQGLEAYVPGEQPSDPRTIKLNTNEFPYPAAPAVLDAIRRETTDRVRVYPNPASQPLREALARRHGVDPAQVLVANGSDEALRLLVHGFGGPGRTMAVVEPSYSLYPVLAAWYETALRVHPLDECIGLPESLFGDPAELCMIAHPNPPLGTVWSAESLARLADRPGMLVLDGAYVDFAQGDPALELMRTYPNVVLTRTFSKSAGLAGMRIGYIVADARLIAQIEPLRDSYNVNRLSQAAALAAVEAWDYYAGRCEELIATRERLTAELRGRGFGVPDSRANFVFARHPQAPRLYRDLKAAGILVRYFAHPRLADGLRITIGTPEEIDALLGTIDTLLGHEGS